MKTGYFLDHVAFGATVYTSNPIYAPDDRDGTGLLAPGQNGYTVLGEFYAELRIVKDVRIMRSQGRSHTFYQPQRYPHDAKYF